MADLAPRTRRPLHGTWHTPYAAVIGSRIRAQRSYRASFLLDLFGSLLVGLTEFAEVWVIFHNVQVLGGLDFNAILLVFGLSNLAFSLADLLVGHIDGLPTFVRMGTLDAFYLRPQPVLAQLMTCEFSLRRLSRIGVAATALVAGLVRCDVDWSLATRAMLPMAIVFGTAIFAGLFVCAASLQFFLINGAELTNSFTYGGSYASSQPASIFPTPLKMIFGYLVPVAFTAYLPTLAILDLPGPAGLPTWLAWLLPLAAAWVWALALTLWRWGTRHYQGGGG
ncbi:ABC transporter permease [Segeticoccus rhizosphaerae]|uniref:ABC transporter permease n=1 Tax=Segeticoccus rhizosphaerae TaxID=1104777 RepID=UPI001EE3B24B|nr:MULTISPECIES: ABC-2 family transporter protein [Intrasporangiaceae]